MMKQYPEVVENERKANVPYVSKYKINPKEDEVILTSTELKDGIKRMQKIVGKPNYIRTMGRLDIDFTAGKLTRLVLYSHKKVMKMAEKLLMCIILEK